MLSSRVTRNTCMLCGAGVAVNTEQAVMQAERGKKCNR